MKKRFNDSLEERLAQMNQLTRERQIQFNGGATDGSGGDITTPPPSYHIDPPKNKPSISISINPPMVSYGFPIGKK